jgi:hypothetical protein
MQRKRKQAVMMTAVNRWVRAGLLLVVCLLATATATLLLGTPAAGAAVGALIGALVKTSRWVPGSVTQLPSPTPTRGLSTVRDPSRFRERVLSLWRFDPTTLTRLLWSPTDQPV